MNHCRAILFGLLLGAICLPAAAAPEDPLLPPQLNDWQRSDFQQVAARNLERLSGSESDLLREYGSQTAASARYSNGDRSWTVTAHRMADRTSAYGAYTFLRRGASSLALGEAGAEGGDGLLFFLGNYFVQADRAADRAALEALAGHLRRMGGPQPSLPPLPEYLPREGLILGSDRFLLGQRALQRTLPLAPGDWVGFAYGAEAEVARYRIGENTATLLLVSYPTPQIAIARLREMEDLFGAAGREPSSGARVSTSRIGTLVALVTGEVTAENAESLFEAIRYGREIAWSNPTKQPTQEEWLNSIGDIFIGTGVMMLLALVVAVGFAAFRLFISRLWPGKVFDRPQSSEIIRLHLGEDD